MVQFSILSAVFFIINCVMACDIIIVHEYYGATMNQAQMALVAVLAVMATLKPSRRKKAVLGVVAANSVWIALTDWAIPPADINTLVFIVESAVWFALFVWVLARPYPIESQVSGKKVCLVFRKAGTKVPILSSIGSLMGFPVSSMSIVASGRWLRINGSRHEWVISDCRILEGNRDWVVINTGIAVTPEIEKAIDGMKGKSAGKGFLRMSCVWGVRHILALLGPEWKPSVYHRLPNLYLYKVIENINNTIRG